MHSNGPSQVSLVALPLGNGDDLSPRARTALETADVIFCEDTRKTRDFCQRVQLNCKARLISLPGDSERAQRWEKIEGDRWALVSDAGTPIVNDPGIELLRYCRNHGISVHAIPGPSAPVLAWQWSGGFGLPFCFAGFAPKARQAGVRSLVEFFAPAQHCRTFVFFDTRHQVLTTLAHLQHVGWGERKIYAGRDMTKPHEELLFGNVDELMQEFSTRLKVEKPLGELTFVLEGVGEVAVAGAKLSIEDVAALREAEPRTAAKVASTLTGLSVKECYAAFVKAKRSDTGR